MTSINNSGVRELRRTQAETRQAQYDALTNEQKIERAKDRRGDSKRELTRLINN